MLELLHLPCRHWAALWIAPWVSSSPCRRSMIVKTWRRWGLTELRILNSIGSSPSPSALGKHIVLIFTVDWGWAHDLYSVLFWYWSPEWPLASECSCAYANWRSNMMCKLWHTWSCKSFSSQREMCVMSCCARIWDKRDEGVFVLLHSVEGAPRAFQWHGRTPVSGHFPVRNRNHQSSSELKKNSAEEMRQECVPVRSAWKRWKAGVRCGVYRHTPLRSWSIRSTSCLRCPEAASRSRYVSVSVRVFRSDGLENDEEPEFFPLCQPPQSCHCQLEFCGCLEVLVLCERTCCWCHTFAFSKLGCLVVATVHAPSSDVCFW